MAEQARDGADETDNTRIDDGCGDETCVNEITRNGRAEEGCDHQSSGEKRCDFGVLLGVGDVRRHDECVAGEGADAKGQHCTGYDENGQAQCDLIAMDGEVIEAGKPITMVNLDSDAIERTITFTPTAVKPLLVPHILGGQLAMELPSIAEKKAYIAKQLTEETWESELRLECPHKHYVNMTPAVAECRARMYAELHGGKV